VGLTLIIEDPELQYDGARRILGRTTIRLSGQDDLAERWQRVAAQPLDLPVAFYDDDGLDLIAEDPYGRPLTWTPAFLLAAAGGGGIGLTPWNHAVLALLMGLGETRVILHWD
jgi:hypothetical protein